MYLNHGLKVLQSSVFVQPVILQVPIEVIPLQKLSFHEAPISLAYLVWACHVLEFCFSFSSIYRGSSTLESVI